MTLEPRPVSATTAASRLFVDEHRPLAIALGRRLADDLDEPAAFVRAAEVGLAELADSAYLAGQRLVAPGIGPLLGVRNPLLDAVERSLVRELRGVGAGRLIFVADSLAKAEFCELRWLALRLLGRIVRDEPERAWQLLRRVVREADDWITIDTTAGFIAPAILREPFRWAELEQLVYSPNRWERRLVGATVASIAMGEHAGLRRPDTIARSLDLLAIQIGDAEPDVQKAISWALRNLTRVDMDGVTTFCLREARLARRTDDGHRAWVLRDAAPKLPEVDAASIRDLLAGIRRVAGSPSTSLAAETAATFVSADRPPTAADCPPTVLRPATDRGRPLPELTLT